ncbi:MAG: ABC transporter permease, partial [Gemmatimonadetes bacterium]|nr:ABC transporter permease [Gemmatimonadota bacterium]
MPTFLHELRQAVRSLRRAPAFTAVAVLTIALGIGGDTAVFSVVDGVLLRPLPYEAPERLVSLEGVSYLGEMVELRARSRALEVAAYRGAAEMSLTGQGEPVRLPGSAVTPELFPLLGVRPLAGRWFRPEEG